MSNYCPYCSNNYYGQSLCDLSCEYGKYGTKTCQQINSELCHRWLNRAIKEKRENYEFISVDGISAEVLKEQGK